MLFCNRGYEGIFRSILFVCKQKYVGLLMLKHLCFVFVYLLLLFNIAAQQVYLIGEDTVAIFNRTDSIAGKKFVERWMVDQVDQGYVNAGILENREVDDSLKITALHRGERYDIERVGFINEQGDTITERATPGKKIAYLSESGYPFARLEIAKVKVDQKRVELIYKIEQGPIIYFDSVQMSNDVPLRDEALYNLLGFYPGQLYNERLFQNIENQISNLQFIDLLRPVDVGFYSDKAKVFLSLETLEVNHFDAMIGLVPVATGASNRLNGYADLHLPNLFKSAVMLDLGWKAFGPQSQSIAIATVIPALGRTGVGVALTGDILRQDSSFVNTAYGLDLRVDIKGSSKLKVGYQRVSSNELSTGARDLANFSYDWYSIGFCHNCDAVLDERRRETRRVEFSAKIGNRQVQNVSNQTATGGLTYGLTHNSTILKTMGSQSLFGLKTRYGFLQNAKGIFENEKFRMGGLQTMRGFFENQFFTKQYGSLMSEFRYYFASSSYLVGLLDGGFIQPVQQSEIYGSAGIGITVGTDSGILKLIFAQGRIFQSGDAPNNLVHFGYSAVF